MFLINKIGQRKFSIYIALCSIFLSLLIYIIRYKKLYAINNISIAPIVIGTILFAFPSIILSICAHKSKNYRLDAVKISFFFMSLNTLIFSLSIFNNMFTNILFLLCIVEILFSFLFLIFVLRDERKRKKTKKTQLRNRL